MDPRQRRNSTCLDHRRRQGHVRDEHLVKKVALAVIAVSGFLFLIVAVIYTVLGKEKDSQILFYSAFALLEVIALVAGLGPIVWSWFTQMPSHSNTNSVRQSYSHRHIRKLPSANHMQRGNKSPLEEVKKEQRSVSFSVSSARKDVPPSRMSQSAHAIKNEIPQPKPGSSSTKPKSAHIGSHRNAKGDFLPPMVTFEMREVDYSRFEPVASCSYETVTDHNYSVVNPHFKPNASCSSQAGRSNPSSSSHNCRVNPHFETVASCSYGTVISKQSTSSHNYSVVNPLFKPVANCIDDTGKSNPSPSSHKCNVIPCFEPIASCSYEIIDSKQSTSSHNYSVVNPCFQPVENCSDDTSKS